MSATAMRDNSGDSTSPEQSLDRDSQSDDVLSEEDDDVSKETNNLPFFPSDNYGQGNILPRNEEILAQGPQPELVGHTVVRFSFLVVVGDNFDPFIYKRVNACAPNPYYDPYYGGMMAAYGQQMVHPQFLDMQQVRMPLPLEMAQEPVYVNAKQYHAILRRRQSRAKAELEKKLIKDRKPYLHESRHQHAMRRVRSSGGRFAKKTEAEAMKHANEDKNNTTSSSSSGMKRVHSDSTESLNTHQEPRGKRVNSCNDDTYGAHFENQDSFQTSSYSDIGEWTTIPTNQASQRTVAMK